MRTSCIKHPAQEPFIVKHRWQWEACDGDGCAAALLSFFEYWHNIKLRNQIKAEQANHVAQMHGDEPHQDASLFQWHTAQELKAALFEYNEKRIRAGLELLKEKRFISVHRNPNPKYAFDNTKYFLFHADVVNEWLSKRESNLEIEPIDRQNLPDRSGQIDHIVRQNRPDDPVESTGPSGRIDRIVRQNLPQQYTKTTSKITSEITSKVTNNKITVAQVQPCLSDNPSALVEKVFMHWKNEMGHPQAKLDESRRRSISKALKSGYTVEELCRAISGCAITPHNMGDNDKGQRFDGLQVILKSADQIERFMGNFHHPPMKRGMSIYEKNITAAQIWLDQEKNEEILHVVN